MVESWESIIGIIDSYGAIHSVKIDYSQSNSKNAHDDYFPHSIMKRWRWDNDKGLIKSVLSSDFDIEDWDKVDRHLKDVYNIEE